MSAIHIRELLYLEDVALQALPRLHRIQFDNDEIVEVFRNTTRYSALFWKVFHQFPNAQILPQHHISVVLNGEELNTSSHRKLATNILRSVVKDHNLLYPEQKEPLLKALTRAQLDAQKALAVITEADVISLDILDFIQISSHPDVIALRESAKAGHITISYAYEKAEKLIRTLVIFDDNNLAKAVRSNMVRINQVMQCVLFRGFPSEVDGTIYPHANWSNYTRGNRSFYQLVSDSRTAAKSHYYAGSALEDSEYNARKFQLFSMVLEHIVYQDCGSTDYTPWLIRGECFDESGALEYSGDLSRLVGKYYCEERGGPLKVLQGNEKNLISRIIYLRSVHKCKHKDPHAVCHVCMGEMSHNFSRFHNVGHLSSTTLTRILTQSVLSFKHVNTSSKTAKILLAEAERRYLNNGKDGSAIYLTAPRPGYRIFLSVIRDQVPGLLDLDKLSDLPQVSLTRIACITDIKIRVVTPDGEIVEDLLKTRVKSEGTMMSRDFLAHVAKHGWVIESDNNFQFDMTHWDFDQALLVAQNKEESVVDLVSEVEKIVQSNQDLHKQRLVKENAPDIVLTELFEKVNNKFNVNIICFEVIIYGLMCASTTSFALSRNAKKPVLGISRLLTVHRSAGSMMAFQEHRAAIFNPGYRYLGHRPDSPMDVFLNPQEVIEAYYGPQS